MESLPDFLIRRAAELREQERQLREKLALIAKEREQLSLAATAAGVVLDPRALGQATFVNRQEHADRSKPRASEATIKQAVVAILQEAGRGMTALEILPKINERLGVDYPRTSLSPQLSRLKNEGVIERDGIVWSLVPRGGDGRPVAPPPTELDFANARQSGDELWDDKE